MLTYKRTWATSTRKVYLTTAVQTLAHEAATIGGATSNAEEECYGMQRLRGAARSLGLTATQATAMVAIQWRQVYPRKPSAYRSSECRNGGALDLRPASSLWP